MRSETGNAEGCGSRVGARSLARWLRWCLLTFALGCSSPHAAATPDVAMPDVAPTPDATDSAQTPFLAPIPMDAFIDRVVDRYCETRFICHREISRCHDYKNRFATFWGRQRLRLVELGRLSYDANAAAECVAAIDCRDFDPRLLFGDPGKRWQRWDTPDACHGVFRGALQAGASCSDDVECADGQCWGCPGTCRPGAAPGEVCGAEADCGPKDVCLVGTCVEAVPRGAGETCTYFQLGCAEGLTCQGLDAQWVGTCHKSQKVGDPCSPLCYTEGLACVGGKCVPAALGAGCSGDASCPWPLSCLNIWPANERRCLPFELYDQACGDVFCMPNAYCKKGVPATCAPNLANGEKCDPADDNCDIHCDKVTATCTEWTNCPEASCVNCADGKTCDDVRVGDPCTGTCPDPDKNVSDVYRMVCVDGKCAERSRACDPL